VYNLEGGEAGEVDAQMVEALRPSIEEAEPVGTQEMALDYIGKRGAQVGLPAGLAPPHRRAALSTWACPSPGVNNQGLLLPCSTSTSHLCMQPLR
jgi:hypothetical protein